MVERMNWEIGLYAEFFERILKWYNMLFKDKHPSKEDEMLYHRLVWLAEDMRRQEREEELEE